MDLRLCLALCLAASIGCSDEPAAIVSVPQDSGVPAAADAAQLPAPDAATPDEDAGVEADAAAMEPDAGTPPPRALYLVFGPDLHPGPRARIEAHVRRASADPVVIAAPDEVPERGTVLSFGDTAATARVIDPAERAALEPEGFLVESATIADAKIFAVWGRGLEDDALTQGNLGLSFGAYALLEELGFAFLHPLQPVVPPSLEIPASLRLTRAPRWRIRGLQLHTMHPLELTDLLNGWGPDGPEDEAGWRAMLPEWDVFLEWLVANGQNRVHWLPLIGGTWREFANSPERYARFAEITSRAHAFGIAAGADVPLALQQQHAWKMIEQTGELDDERAQIRARVDAMVAAGFDYFATENGITEFTHGSDERMLAWMDELASYATGVHGKPTYIKIHASTGQAAENFIDPRTGQPANFNFLPHFADPRLGVLPHTVQHYSLDDPAPTYGNESFQEMRDFLVWQLGTREVVWHPETAYWVSFDIDVPLFLPVYADRRLYDLRLIAGDEATAGRRMDGQLTFSSGWEWGYWVQEVITARAAIDPLLDELDHRQALRRAFTPIVRPFGAAADRAAELLVEMARSQHALLIEGRQNGVAPSTTVRRNGQAYLQGVEAFDDLADAARNIPGLPDIVTQPDKLGLVEMRSIIHAPPRYRDVRPLLVEMAQTFRRQATAFAALEPEIPAHARPLFDDLRDASEITALRAEQVLGLYDYVDTDDLTALTSARNALDRARVIVDAREPAYRVPEERIAAWRNNPTAYEFTYLWTVHSLYFWWRDELKAVDVPRSPCVLNIINPADIALGEGIWLDVARFARDAGRLIPGIGSLAECLAETRAEPVLPPPGLRSRP